MSQIISSKDLNQLLLPYISEHGSRFRKTSSIKARDAIPGELIVTRTSDGKETENTASENDKVVQNYTEAEEQYIVSTEVFDERYSIHKPLDEKWTEYEATGEIQAIMVDSTTLSMIGARQEVFIEAPWGSTQPVRIGDYLAIPLPAGNEIYRIAAQEFATTYQPTQ